MSNSWSRRTPSCVVALVSLAVSAVVLPTTPVAAAAVTTEPTVRLVVSHDRSTSGGDLVDAISDDVAASHPRDVPELATSTLDVPVSEASTAVADLNGVDGVTSVHVDHRATMSTGVVPNDPLWSSQSTLVSMGVPDAWTQSTGSASAVIAVIDTGVDPTPDLGSRLMAGYDFVHSDSNPADDNGHGSDVASIIAAGGNDGATMAGVCWTCRVLPVKVLDSNGSGYMSDVASGIVWATNQGATVINLSLGSPSADISVSNAVNYAVAHDVVVLAAAGNDGSTNHSYPGADDNVVAVAAHDPSGALYSWSQRGSSWVDVSAPGCNVADGGGSPGTFCGTSSATPMAAGAVGLLRSYNPSANRGAVINALTSTATALATAGQVASGRINAAAAMNAMPPPPGISSTPPPTDVDGPTVSIDSPSDLRSGVVSTIVHASDPSGVSVVALSTGSTVLGTGWIGPDGASVIQWDSSAYGDSTVALTVGAVDSVGNHSTATGSVTVDNAAPKVGLWSTSNGQTVTGAFGVAVGATDGNGAKVTLVVANGRWVAGFAGNSLRTVVVTPWTNGPLLVVAVTVDQSGHVAFSNAISVKVRLKSRSRGRH